MEELDLKEIFKMLWSNRRIIIVVTVVLMIIAIIYSFVIQTPKYQSYTTLVLTKAENTEDSASTSVTQTDVTMNQKLVSTYSEIVKSKNILSQVIENLQIANLTQADLRSNVTVEAIEDTEVIKIIVSNENPEYAAKIANEIGRVFSEKIVDMYKINNIYTLDEAEVSHTPYNKKPVKNIIIAILAGIFISCAFIIVRSLFDTTVKTAEEIEKALKVPVIAQIAYYDSYIDKKGGKKV